MSHAVEPPTPDTRTVEARVRACYAAWGTTYHDDYCGDAAGYPPVHYDLVRRLLDEHGARRVLDAGCGPASFLRTLDAQRHDLYGFDLTDEMVFEARRVLGRSGVPPERLWTGSVCRIRDFQPPDGGGGAYDAIVCIGVLPHVRERDETLVLDHAFRSLRPGGLVVLEARNELFGLFTLNRYTDEMFRTTLVDAADLAADPEAPPELAEALERMSGQFRMDLPPVRSGSDDHPGYDEILSRTHNPFVLPRQVEACGFTDVRVHFYHFHCLPPMFESIDPSWYRRRSLAMEDPNDWRGHVMASAFVVTGRTP